MVVTLLHLEKKGFLVQTFLLELKVCASTSNLGQHVLVLGNVFCMSKHVEHCFAVVLKVITVTFVSNVSFS